MSLWTGIVLVVVAVMLAAACERLRYRVGQIPALVRGAADQARQEGAAAFQAAVTARLADILVPLAAFQERLVQTLRAEVTEARLRTRTAETRAAESRLALEASALLVRDLRRLLAEQRAKLPTIPPAEAAPPPAPLPSTVPPPGGRRPRSCAAPEDAGDSDVTQVVGRLALLPFPVPAMPDPPSPDPGDGP